MSKKRRTKRAGTGAVSQKTGAATAPRETPGKAAGARDVLKALGLGIAGGILLGLVAGILGALVGGAGLSSGLEAAKDALLFVAALMLFVLAGMLLLKGKKGERPLADMEGWRRHFAVIGPKSVLGAMAAGVVIAAIAADYLQFALR